MGLLSVGQPLSWPETKNYSRYVRTKGIDQFTRLYHMFKSRTDYSFKYGDEVEYTLIKLDRESKRVYLLLKAHQILPLLTAATDAHDNDEDKNESEERAKYTPEFAAFMVEGMPATPYDHTMSALCRVEANMSARRRQIQRLLDHGEYVLTCTTFPLIGSMHFTWPSYVSNQQQQQQQQQQQHVSSSKHNTTSICLPDEVIYPSHPRYVASIRNNRERRISVNPIHIPIFVDKRTPRPFHDDLSAYFDATSTDDYNDDSDDDEVLTSIDHNSSRTRADHIYMEDIGASCSCLQVTVQARDMSEARRLYDQLTPMAPIMLALSAASPIWRGFLTEIDCRWPVISASLDDRTAEERGHCAPLKHAGEQQQHHYRIEKSRYDSVDCYVSEQGAAYNDVRVVKDEQFYARLLENGVDSLMAQHVAHLFVRDPIILFKEQLHESPTSIEHFENIQSTNWQSLRLKPPPSCEPSCDIGWRVEFRTCEVQTSDTENAAIVTFMVLLSRAILSYDLNLLVPISLVDENMRRAERRDACRGQLFYFRKHLLGGANSNSRDDHDDHVVEMSMNTIMNGNGEFVGLVPLVRDYVAHMDVDVKTHCRIVRYLDIVAGKASGELKTTATFMRDFVRNHSTYKFDSRVSDEIAYDLMARLNDISNGCAACPELFGSRTV